MTANKTDKNRREFLKVASIAAVGLAPLSALALSGCSRTEAQRQIVARSPKLGRGSPCGACDAPADLSWQTQVTAASEPGDPLDITGTIFCPDGVTPAGNIVLFTYHTDATGFYNKEDDVSRPRLRGWMKTGPDGRYGFRTIKPAPYPHRTSPAHIHAHLFGPGYDEYWIDEYWFEGDPFITDENKAKLTGRGGFNSIVSLERDKSGVLFGRRNIKLETV